MNAEIIAPTVIAFAVGLWPGWWRARLEHTSLEEWVNVLQDEVRRARTLLLAWIVVGMDLSDMARQVGQDHASIQRCKDLIRTTKELLHQERAR